MAAARSLLRAGARLDIADLAGHTPLHYAARVGLSATDREELLSLAAEAHRLDDGAQRRLLGRVSRAGQTAEELGLNGSRRIRKEELHHDGGLGSDDEGWGSNGWVRQDCSCNFVTLLSNLYKTACFK